MKYYKTEPLTAQKERELFLQLKEKKLRQTAIDNITRANIGMVIKIARRHKVPGIELEDLVQEGTLGLLRAIDKFDPARGTRFTTFAYPWIKAFVIQCIQDSGQIRIPRQTQYIKGIIDGLAQKLGRKPTARQVLGQLKRKGSALAAKDFIQELIDLYNQEFVSPNYLQFAYDSAPWQLDHIADDSYRAERVDAGLDVKKLIPLLSERNQEIIKLCYGIDRDKPLDVIEVGKKLKLSRETIRQAVAKSIQIMQEYVHRESNN